MISRRFKNKYQRKAGVIFHQGFFPTPFQRLKMCVASLALPLIFNLPLSSSDLVDEARPAPASAEERGALIRALAVRPSPAQLAWQNHTVYGFIHFGPNTFSDCEWGSGKEDPTIFNPTDLDARQWVEALKTAGCSMVMLTVKHHEGFCLYPSRYTKQSVISSPWKGGKGDIMREVSEACKEFGLKLGVYLSPADLYEIKSKGGRYGNKSVPVESVIPTPVEGRPFPNGHRQFNFKVDDYNRYFLNQLYELLTEYGQIEEVWFDGANPHGGTGQKYDRDIWYGMIRDLAPNAMIAIDGPDVRWIGNEGGHARENEWSVVPNEGPNQTKGDLGSRAAILNSKELIWKPGEADVSIRPGWFYHAAQDSRVRSPQNLFGLYLSSVGRNATLLLNVPPDRRGRFSDIDVLHLKKFGQALQNTFGNQACGLWNDGKPNPANVASSAPAEVLDNSSKTVWSPSGSDWTFEFKAMDTAQLLMLEEDIAQGQRIEKFSLSKQENGAWKVIGSGGTVGARRIITIPQIAAGTQLKLEIVESRARPRLTEIGLFSSSLFTSEVIVRRNKDGKLSLLSPLPDAQIRYTLDGSEPSINSTLYQEPFSLDQGGLVRSLLVSRGRIGPVTTQQIGLSKSAWKICSVSSEEAQTTAAMAIDEDLTTFWHTGWRKAKVQPPHEIVIDLGSSLTSTAFTYLPRQDTRGKCCIDQYVVYISNDLNNFGTAVLEGRFDNIANNPIEQVCRFSQPVTGRYLKFIGTTSADGRPEITAAEIGLLGK